MRTPEQKAYHAQKEREYRRRARERKDAAMMQFGAAASTLLGCGYTVGQLTDLIMSLSLPTTDDNENDDDSDL